MDGCRKYDELWFGDEEGGNGWSEDRAAGITRKPIAPYSKRSNRIAELRARIVIANVRDDEDCAPPTDAAIASAESFINTLADGVLSYSCRIAISSAGEINFFFGREDELFQVLILEDGRLSYHAQNQNDELIGSEIDPADFPHLPLLGFLSHHQ